MEEVIVGKRKIQETKQIQDTIKKEEARIERSGPPSLDVGTPISELAAAGLEEAMTEIPDIMTVEGNPDMETIKAELKKEENHGKRMGSNDVPGEKNKQSSPSETRTDSPSIKKNESKNNGPKLAATMQEEAANNNGSNSVATMQKEATKKNENKSQVRKGKNSNN